MIVYADVFKMLKDRGWTQMRLRKEKVMGGTTVVHLTSGQPVSTSTIDTICRLCNCQPGDILKYVPDEEGAE